MAGGSARHQAGAALDGARTWDTKIGMLLAAWLWASSRSLGPTASHLCFSLYGWVKGI